MPAPLLTLRAVASALRLPESTVRYYRDAFAEYLPTVGVGRRRRYPTAALPLFELIAQRFAAAWSRDDIRSALAESAGALGEASPTSVVTPEPVPHHLLPAAHATDLLSVVLDGERERREVLWQLAREVVRLGEAVERQHAVLSAIAHELERRAAAALPAPGDGTAAQADSELAVLRDELAREREMVERLRRSKLDIERRAAEAEAALAEPHDGRLRRLFAHRLREADAG